MMIYKVCSKAFNLRDELSDVMKQYDIVWSGFQNSVGSKCPTFYSIDEKMDALVGHQILTDRHRIFINEVPGRLGMYYASFQPHLTRRY